MIDRHRSLFGSDAALFLHKVEDAFRRRYPDCQVEIVELQLRNGLEMLQTDQVHMEPARNPAAMLEG
ncbi:hypothetical protein [Streptomyces sp. NPDC059874]|uniref:hypothetical protein n=1 Tax=Streptomyces sp. NPDC059874 TaxID=3346983 RepID=UPI0036585F8A